MNKIDLNKALNIVDEIKIEVNSFYFKKEKTDLKFQFDCPGTGRFNTFYRGIRPPNFLNEIAEIFNDEWCWEFSKDYGSIEDNLDLLPNAIFITKNEIELLYFDEDRFNTSQWEILKENILDFLNLKFIHQNQISLLFQ
ncbi:MAG: hypothetical protein N4A44_00685 [Alphaproteobacteria bacterium]|jgi:hypothetical protein|nr:hypothetical protein [Alphaproteobacteria bacterium]